MLELIKEPEIVGVISGLSTSQATITDRPSHMFIYKIDGESVYYLRKKEIHLIPGTILYVPEHETYSFWKQSQGDSRYCLINFHAQMEGKACPQLFSLPSGENAAQLFKQMERSWRFEGTAGRYESLSLFYHLLALLARSEQVDYMTGEKKERIAPAIAFLEAHIFDSSLKICDLPELCGISGPTFRRIFISRFGVSPKKYISQQRLLQAKILLESGEYESIAEVARLVGYEDPLYFSKHFNSYYGTSPSYF